MCQYFSKTEDLRTQVKKKRSKESFESNMHLHDTMKTTAKVYLSNLRRSTQEAAYNILLELKFRRKYFDFNLPEENF